MKRELKGPITATFGCVPEECRRCKTMRDVIGDDVPAEAVLFVDGLTKLPPPPPLPPTDEAEAREAAAKLRGWADRIRKAIKDND